MRNSAALGALLIVLAWYSRKQKSSARASKLVSDWSEVAHKATEKEGEHAFDEFDVIVIGGGTSDSWVRIRLSCSLLCVS